MEQLFFIPTELIQDKMPKFRRYECYPAETTSNTLGDKLDGESVVFAEPENMLKFMDDIQQVNLAEGIESHNQSWATIKQMLLDGQSQKFREYQIFQIPRELVQNTFGNFFGIYEKNCALNITHTHEKTYSFVATEEEVKKFINAFEQEVAKIIEELTEETEKNKKLLSVIKSQMIEETNAN